MIKQNITTIPTHGTRQSTVRKAALRLRAQTNVFRRVSGEIGAVDPEAEKGVGTRGGVVDKDLGDVDIADEGFVVGC